MIFYKLASRDHFGNTWFLVHLMTQILPMKKMMMTRVRMEVIVMIGGGNVNSSGEEGLLLSDF